MAAMTFEWDKKWRPFKCFFQSGQAKDLIAILHIAFPVLTFVDSVYCAVRTGFHNDLLFGLKKDNVCLLNVEQ